MIAFLVAAFGCLPATASAVPTMNVTSPVEGAVVNTSAPIITGSIDAGTGVTGWGWIGGFYPQCTVDSLPIYNCNQMWGLAQGSHVLTVELRSYLTGLAVDGQSKTINFTVHDTSPPTLSSTQPASGGVISNGQGDISIVASPDAAAFSAPGLNCYLAGSYYMPSPNGVTEMFTLFYCTLADQTDGPRNIAYSLVDRAGNTASGNLIWTVSDPTAPSLEVESPVDAATYPSSTLAPDGTFDKGQGFGRADWLDTNYTESEARCSVDGATPTREQCQFVDHLSDGEHTFAVSIWDYWAETQMAGVGATLDFEVSDAVAPSILGTKPAAGSTITDVAANVMLYTSPDIETISVAGLSCPASGYRARRSSPDWPYRQPRTEFICKISGATNGAHVATYQMTDWAGNASSGSLNWTVDDITAPQIAITQPANGSTISSEEVQFSFEMYGDAEVSCQLDNQPLDCQEFVDTYGYLRGHFSHVALAGAHTFAVTATDSVGNSSTKASSFTVVPTTPSATSPFLIAAPEAGQTVATSALAVTARIHDRNGSAPAKNPFCRIDDGDWQSCERAIPLVPGAHQLDGKLVAGATHDSPTVPNTEKSVAFDALQDQTAPAITGVTDGMTVNNALQTIPVGASFDTQSLTAEGFTCAKSDYSFSQEWEFSTVTASNFLCTASQLSYGTENVTFNATDYADNTATIVRSITFALPTPSAQNPFVITTPYTGQTVTSSALAVSGQIYQRSGSTYKYPYCKLDDGEWQQCETVIPLSAGSHSLQTKLVEGWNSAGPIVPNSESTIPFIAAADVTAPVMTMANNMTIPDSSQTFVVGSSIDTDSVTAEGFTCSRNSYSTSYAAEYSTSIAANFYCRASQISNGTQSVTFTATDNAGNTGTMVRSITYNDLSAPTITNLSPADGSSKESRYTSFDFDISGSVNTICSLNGASENCSWGGMYSRTLDYGTHVWVIQARDAVGNSTTRMSTFQIADVTPPSVSIAWPAAGQTFAARFAITYAASDTSGESLTYGCRIDASAWDSCSSSQYTVSSSTNGSHEFFVRVADLAGNETVRSVTFNVNDTQAPTIAIDNALDGATFDSSNVPNSTFSNDDPNAAIICKLDGIRYDCEGWSGTIYFYRALANGPHTVELTATDWIGNQSIASATFTVADTTAPAVSLVSPQPAAVLIDGTNVSADFDVDSDEDFDFTCSLDGQPFSEEYAWSSSCEYPSLPNGAHTISAKATDASGNATTSSVSFTVNDTVGPTITITDPETQPYSFATNPRFYFDVVGEVGSASCSFDGATPYSCHGYFGGSLLDQGDHQFTVTAVDGANNATTLTVPFSYIDDVPPDVSIASPANGAVLTSSPIAPPSFSGNDQWNVGRTCTVDGLPLGQNCSSNFVWQSLANGQHTLKLWASDSYGNTTFEQSIFTINDVTNETVTIGYPTSGQIVTDSAAYFYFGIGTNYAGWYCRIDARAWSSCSGSFQPTRLKNGPHTFTVMKKDNGERVASSTTSFTVADVTPPPSFSIANLSQGETLSLGTWRYLYSTPYMSGGTEQCFLDGVKLSYCSFEAKTPGPHTLRMVRSDPSGNTTEKTVDFNVAGAGGEEEPGEGEPLNLAVSDPLPGATVPVSPMVRYTTNRPAVKRLYGWVDESEDKSRLRVTSTGWRPAAITEGAHTINLQAVGFDGNVESLAIPVVVDDAEPSLVNITAPKLGATVTQSPARIRFTTGSDITSSECRVDGGAWFECSSYYALVPAGLGNGSHTVEVRVTDFGGHEATDSRTFTIADSTPPEFQITSPTENQVLTENVSLNLDIAKGEGYATVRCKLNGAPLDGALDDACSKKQSLSGFQPGANQLEVTLTDGVGNVATRVVNFTAISTTTQLLQILQPVEGQIFTDSSYAVAFWVARELEGDRPTRDYDHQVECNVDGSGWSSDCPRSRYFSAPGLPLGEYRSLAASNGAHSLGIRLTDFLGNSSVASVNYSVDDQTPPVIEVDEPASGATYADGDVPLALDGAGVIDFECSLDEAVDFTPCVSSQSYGYWADQLPLASGNHELRIRATDPAGNTTSIARSFSVAASAAAIDFTAGPSGVTNDSTPTFAANTTPEGLAIECRIDELAWVETGSPYTTSTLTDGAHSVSCRARLASGGTSVPATRSFTVDTVAPNTSFVSGPEGTTNDSSPSFSVLSSEAPGGTYECRLDLGGWQTRPSAFTLDLAADGAHTLECRAIDSATNVDPTPASRSFIVDTVAPTTAISGAALTNDATPTFAIAVNEPLSTTRCRADLGAFVTVGGSFTPAALSDGSHEISCASTDVAGNIEAPAASRSIVVDTTPPQTEIPDAPSGVIGTNSFTVNPTANELGSAIQCRVNSGIYTAAAPAYSRSELGDGAYVISCRATDPAGNIDPTPATSSFAVDTTPPQITFSAPAPNAWKDTSEVQVAFGVSDAHSTTQTCRVDDGASAPCDSSFNTGALIDGSHTAYVTATDIVGNASTRSIVFNVDTVAPVTSTDASPAALSSDPTPEVHATADEPATIECRLDEGTWVTAAGGLFHPGSLADGDHSIECRAIDRAENPDVTPTRIDFVIDTVAPELSIIAPAENAVIGATSFAAQFTAVDPHGATTTCRVNGGSETACQSPFAIGGLTEGPNSLTVSATDGASNNAEITRSFLVDLTPPETSFSSAPEELTADSTPQLGITSNEVNSTFECSIDGGAWTDVPATFITDPLVDGDHSVECRASDAAGTTDPIPVVAEFTVDTAPPVVGVPTPLEGEIVTTASPTFEISASDLHPGEIRCAFDDSALQSCPLTVVAGWLSEGAHIFKVEVEDAVGNKATTTRNFVVAVNDTTAPETTLLAAPSGSVETLSAATFLSNEPHSSFECALDDDAFLPCASGVRLLDVSLGAHTFRVRAIDYYGNADQTPAQSTFMLVAPTATNHTPTATLSLSKTGDAAPASVVATIGGADDEGDSLTYELSFGDGSAAQTGALPAGPISHVYNEEGSFLVALTVRDATGERRVSRAFTVATPEPLVADAGDALVTMAGETVEFNGSGSRPAAAIESYHWNFGDGSDGDGSAATHTYDAAGTYTATLTVERDGDTATDSVVVDAKPLGTPSLRVHVTGGGQALAGADVMIMRPDGGKHQARSNAQGEARLFGVDDGAVSVYVWADSFVPKVSSAEVAGGIGEMTVDLVAGQPGAATLNSKRLTYDEIIEAGIDVADPANSHVHEGLIYLKFGQVSQPVKMLVWPGGSRCVWNCGNGGSGGGGGGGSGGGGGGIGVGGAKFYPQVIYVMGEPVIEWLVIPIRASWLKEFFKVSLVVQNFTTGFDFSPGVASVQLPEGLALAPLENPQSATVPIGSIPGGSSRSVDWYIRGDVEGEYDLSADYSTIVEPIGEPLRITAETQEPIKVYGASALDMTIYVDPDAHRWGPYHIDVEMKNVTEDVPIYNMQVEMFDRAADALPEHALYFFAPMTEQVQGTDVIEPGESWKAEYVVFPGIGSSTVQDMVTLFEESFVRRTGGDVDLHPDIQPRTGSDPFGFAGDVQMDINRQPSEDFAELAWNGPAAPDGLSVTGYELWTRQSLRVGGWHKYRDFSSSSAVVPSTAESLGRYYAVGTKYSNGAVKFQHRVKEGPSRYVALGDSYSSGEGVPQYEAATNQDGNKCHRSERGSYSRIIADDPEIEGNILPATFVACSGAVTRDMERNNASNAGEVPQVEHLNRFTNTVSLSLGGNDIGFRDIAIACLVRDCVADVALSSAIGSNAFYNAFANVWSSPAFQALSCVAPSTPAQRIKCAYTAYKTITNLDEVADPERTASPRYIWDGTLRNRLERVYGEISSRAPNAHVFVQKYPHVVNPVADGRCELFPGMEDSLSVSLTRMEQIAVNWVIDDLNTEIELAVQTANSGSGGEFTVVESQQEFDTHALCEGPTLNVGTYFNPIVSALGPAYGDMAESFHPNALGQRAYARALKTVMNKGIQNGVVKVPQNETVNAGRVFVPRGARKVRAEASWPGSTVKLSLVSPSGVTINATTAGATSGGDETTAWLEFPDPEEGDWQVKLYGEDVDPGGEPTRVTAMADAPPPTDLEPEITADPQPDGNTFGFTASGPEDAEYVWAFVDGETASGKSVDHTFPSEGPRWATLVVRSEDGGSGTASMTLATPDHEPPAISGMPSSQVVEATSSDGAQLTYAAPTASDNVDGVLTPTCAPASGSTREIGIHTVVCSVSDVAGNSDSETFTIEVRDTTAPTFDHQPDNISIDASSPTGAHLAFGTVMATDAVDGPRIVTCDPAPGTLLSIGPHNVECTTADSRGNSAAVSFVASVVNRSTVAFGAITVNGGAATFNFSNGKGGPYECSRDGAAFAACTSPHSLSGLAAGAHSFRVRPGGSDALSFSATSHDWTVAPEPSVTPPPSIPPVQPPAPTPEEPKIVKPPKLDSSGGKLAINYTCQQSCSMVVTVKIGKKKYTFTKKLAATNGAAKASKIALPKKIKKLVKKAKKSGKKVVVSAKIR